jgi:hypothetical protein
MFILTSLMATFTILNMSKWFDDFTTIGKEKEDKLLRLSDEKKLNTNNQKH